MRVPDMPTGWPSAIAPPLTLTLSSDSPSSRADSMPTAANASLNSTRSRSETAMPSFSQAFTVALAGCIWRVESGPATMPWAPISASHSRPSSSALALLITTTAAAPSEICDAEPAVIVPSLLKAGRSLDSDSAVVSPRTPSSCGDDDRVAPALRDLDRHDLVVEEAVLPGLGGALVGAGGELVLLLAGQLDALGVGLLGQAAHGLLGDLVVERVVRHRVDQRHVAVLEALARLRQQVGRVGHRLHAAGDHDLDLTGADQLVGHRDRVQAREADLVDGDRRQVQRQARGHAGGAGGVLAGPGQDDLAHDQVVDLLRRDAGLVECTLDGVAAELRGGQGLEASEQASDRGAGPGDDHGSGHVCASIKCVLPIPATIPTSGSRRAVGERAGP